MEVLFGQSLINSLFSSQPCLITGRYIFVDPNLSSILLDRLSHKSQLVLQGFRLREAAQLPGLVWVLEMAETCPKVVSLSPLSFNLQRFQLTELLHLQTGMFQTCVVGPPQKATASVFFFPLIKSMALQTLPPLLS